CGLPAAAPSRARYRSGGRVRTDRKKHDRPFQGGLDGVRSPALPAGAEIPARQEFRLRLGHRGRSPPDQIKALNGHEGFIVAENIKPWPAMLARLPIACYQPDC